MADPAAPEPDLDQIDQFVVSGPSGESVFEAGDAGRGLCIIQEGEIELLAPADGDEVRVARLGPGDFFGERTLFDDAPCEVTARSLTDYRVVVLDRRAFERVVAEEPAIGMSLIGWLARQLATQRVELARALQTTGGTPEGAPSEVAEVAGSEAAGAIPSEAAEAAAGEAATGPGPEEPAAEIPSREETPAPGEEDAPEVVAGRALLRHPDSGAEFPIPAEPAGVMIGRSDPDSGIAPDLDFGGVEQGMTLSRRHARIVPQDDGFYLVDQGAANGTFVNGERIAADTPVKLQGGDEIRFGLVETVFEQD